jgi:hypothetical protein
MSEIKRNSTTRITYLVDWINFEGCKAWTSTLVFPDGIVVDGNSIMS